MRTILGVGALLACHAAWSISLNDYEAFEQTPQPAGPPDGWEQPAIEDGVVYFPADTSADNHALVATSAGYGSPGSKLKAVNRSARWTGDYAAAGVSLLEINFANHQADALTMAIGLRGGPGNSCFASASVLVAGRPPDGEEFPEQTARFVLNAATMTRFSGSDSFDDVYREVTELMVMSPETPGSCFGSTAELAIGIDDVRALADADLDAVDDARDNCPLVANADQRDTDQDGFGNACDPDLNNDGVVNVIDLGLLRSVFFTADPLADFDGDGLVNVVDLGILRSYFFGPPGR